MNIIITKHLNKVWPVLSFTWYMRLELARLHLNWPVLLTASASLSCILFERLTKKEGERESGGRERETCVCVCVCVCEEKRERESYVALTLVMFDSSNNMLFYISSLPALSCIPPVV